MRHGRVLVSTVLVIDGTSTNVSKTVDAILYPLGNPSRLVRRCEARLAFFALVIAIIYLFIYLFIYSSIYFFNESVVAVND